ncbi:IclR family transcriptional regulator [Corynebacterium suranareeae]|uniref:IclR family transcriptional regulator n=1 Tax=Corynebacterium suranareeae TaxID=2506452 RepID=A0A160PNG5_9CORY|nr:helix-turn-helix domain-containing protein [Corynebacterium suranareeae]BAU94363.1 IclR family transcriptional regulator [Corynebacterium suranareeae]
MTEDTKPVGAKTLDNGLRVLEAVTAESSGITLTELAAQTHLHATVVFRLLQTLEAHRLVRRDENKRYFAGSGLIHLAASVDVDLKALVSPYLQRLADRTQASAYVMISISETQVMAEQVVQPMMHLPYVTFSAGSIHALDRGSGGRAILAGRAPSRNDSEEVKLDRERGYSISHGEVLPNVYGVAAPLSLPDRFPEASIGVSLLDDKNLDEIADLVRGVAREISLQI